MATDKSLRIRVDNEEFERLKNYAESKKVTMSHIIRQYIRRLPNPKTDSH